MKITRAMAVELCGYCRKGLKAGAQTYGLDWERFCSDGIDAEELAKTGDPRLLRLIERAKQ
jgi:hypothetical protein